MATNNLRLQPAAAEDADFLYNVIKTTMRDYIAQVWKWDDQRQRQNFQKEFVPGKDQLIIKDGAKIGVISTEKQAGSLFLAKIYILPEHQGQQIGTTLLKGVLAEAAGYGLPVTLRVLKVNPAKRFYERLGFVVTGETAMHYWMKAR